MKYVKIRAMANENLNPNPNVVFTLKMYNFFGHHKLKIKAKSLKKYKSFCEASNCEEFYSKYEINVFNNLSESSFVITSL